MKKIFLFILAIIFVASACSNPWKFVYTNGSALAKLQDSLLQVIKNDGTVSSNIVRDLKINWWVKEAYRSAPGNLVIRQYCIIDLIEKKSSHKRKIENEIELLSNYCNKNNCNDISGRTWAEGYSYFIYTKEALIPWIKMFKDSKITLMVSQIDSGFAATSYLKDNSYYPAPFGDLRLQSLDSAGQKIVLGMCTTCDVERHNIYRLYKDTCCFEYIIKAMPVGLNNHCEVENHLWKVINGNVIDFKLYEGYDKKYFDKEAELKDILDPRRLVILPFIW